MANATEVSSEASSVSVVDRSNESSTSATTNANRNSSNGNGAHSSDNENGVNLDNSEVESDLLLEQFLAACTPLLKFPEDEKIIKKLRKHYGTIDILIRQSDHLHSTFQRFIIKVQTEATVKIYEVMQSVDDKFKECKTQLSDEQARRAKHIKKLENYLNQLDKKIKEVQEKDVDFDDEENSNYVLESRLKEQFTRVWNKLCEVVEQGSDEPLKKIVFNGSRFPEINTEITKFLKKLKRNNDDAFPDYKTILELIEEINEEYALRLCEKNISEEAKLVFEGVGKLIKKRRIEEFQWTLGCNLTDDVDDKKDPALQNSDLKQKLEVNQEIGSKNLEEVINKYAQLQEDNREEPVEYDDQIEEEIDEDEEEEGEESESESDEEDHESLNLNSDRSSPVTTDMDENSTDSKSAQSVNREINSVEDRNSPVATDMDENSTDSKPAQSVKRELSSVEKEVPAPQAKKRAVLQSFDDDDDDVIVLSD